MGECIEVDDISQKKAIVGGGIGFEQYLVADTQRTEPEVEEFLFFELQFSDLIYRLVECVYLLIDGVDFVNKLLNECNFWF